ncbi:MAG: hopanoid biosynthesis-associated protein HpnK [Anaerolineae bacterium]|nr:hopanoid biosynthesis-associated protein HpnK [Anaerolineae bacterium]MDW8102150.1 hopanoid biosynthesis-associated protein HpnK [Anaerolineae bacterium]
MNEPGPWVIFNADDFGDCSEINEAIIRAHREGVLTSASLMVGGKAFEEAVKLAWENPSLAVGLHVTLAEGWPSLSPQELVGLADEKGKLKSGSVVGFLILFRKDAREALFREMEEQFRRFLATGLQLSHVDGHLHLHLHPLIFPELLHLAEEFGASGIRIPRDNWSLSLKFPPRRFFLSTFWALIYAPLVSWASKLAKGRSLIVVDRVYGLFKSGSMSEEYVVGVLKSLRGSSAELYFHPTSGPRLASLGPNPGDLDTLMSPRIRQVIEERGIRLATYPMLRRESRGH